MATIFPDEGLNWILGLFDGTNSAPANLYLGLFAEDANTSPTTVPASTAVLSTETGVTEVTGTNYARKTIAAADWTTYGDEGTGRKLTSVAQQMATAGAGGWDEANGFFIATASTAGIAIYYSNFSDTTAVTLGENDTITITPFIGFDAT